MSVLSDVDIKKVIRKNKGIIIMNMHDDEDHLTAVGYDLTIGMICDAELGNEPKKVECIYDSESHKEYRKDELEKNPKLNEEYQKNVGTERFECRYRYELLPKHRYLVVSEEYVALLYQYMATIHSRGSYALKGLIVTSTTIDPNYMGFIYASLVNCSGKPVYIKEHNQFATMVIHKIATPTNMSLPNNEQGMPKNAEQTLNGSFSNNCIEAVKSAQIYETNAMKKIQHDFTDKYADFRNRRYVGKSLADLGISIRNMVSGGSQKKGFWIGIAVVILVIVAFCIGGVDKVVEVMQQLLS